MHYPTTYSPVITPDDYCTIFNFYIPPEAAGKTCALEFLFPELDQLEESTFTYSGGGHFTFSGYVGYGATNETTWNNQPSPGNSLYNPPPQILTPGHRYALNKPYPGSCIITKGMPALEIGGKLCSNDTIFTYFQDDSVSSPTYLLNMSDTDTRPSFALSACMYSITSWLPGSSFGGQFDHKILQLIYNTGDSGLDGGSSSVTIIKTYSFIMDSKALVSYRSAPNEDLLWVALDP